MQSGLAGVGLSIIISEISRLHTTTLTMIVDIYDISSLKAETQVTAFLILIL